MSKETSTSTSANQNNGGFEPTEQEKLYDRVSHPRFMALVAQDDVSVHEVTETTNAFGEFLFVTLSSQAKPPGHLLTFFGLGYHEQRERWITEYWQWYESHRKAEQLGIMSKREALEKIKAREELVRSLAAEADPPSRRGRLYSLLAYLTDEDGALAEMEDLGLEFLAGEDDQSGG